MRTADSLEKALMLVKIEGRRRRGWQRMQWVMSLPTQWMWIWASSRRWWRTGKPGVLQSMRLESPKWLCNCKTATVYHEADDAWVIGPLMCTISFKAMDLFGLLLITPLHKLCHTQLQPIPFLLTYLLGMKQFYLDILASHRDQSNMFFISPDAALKGDWWDWKQCPPTSLSHPSVRAH